MSISSKIGTSQTLNEWVKKADVDAGKRAGNWRPIWRPWNGRPGELRQFAAHSTPDEERSVAGFRPDMTVVKAQQDFLTHERHCTQRACNHGIGTKSSNRVWFKRCKYRSDSPKPWMCSTAASTAQLSTTYALRQHPGSLLTSACRPWKNWPISRTLRSAHHAARRCVNCAGREPNPSRFADTAALSVKTVEKNEARSRCTNIPTGARP